jgi:hypothetical protein
VSELVILCHHILCDGLSLAYLTRDLMHYLGDPDREVDALPDPVPMDRDSIPEEIALNAVVRYLIRRMNRKWGDERITFDQEDYRDLNQAYWTHYPHQILAVELNEAQTSGLVDRCRHESITVNSALTTAFVGAQVIVQGVRSFSSSIGVATSLRDRLRMSAGEVMGFYAGMASLKQRYRRERGFWDNARDFHRKLEPRFSDRNLFQDLITWCYLDPTILEAVSFKVLGQLVPAGAATHEKISAFAARDDVVLSVLKRDQIESPDRVTMGTAVTNLGRLDFPRQYGALSLDRLIMKPGSALPLANVNLVLGAVTCSGVLSLLVEYVEANVDARTMEEIKDRALGLLVQE